MAINTRRLFFKYAKCLVITIVVAFFVQILIAVYLFPPENDNLLTELSHISYSRQEMGDVPARKLNPGVEDLAPNTRQQNKPVTSLRLEELDFKPACDVKSREAISAIHRARTQSCKQQIVNKTCLIQSGNFYPEVLPHRCLSEGVIYGKHLGCFKDEKEMRLLSNFSGNYAKGNTPSTCLDICVQAGLSYAGVQYG